MALLCYRTTPLHNGFIPAQLLMGRQLGVTYQSCQTIWNQPGQTIVRLQDKEDRYKEQMKLAYDRRHGAQPLEHLKKDDAMIIDGKEEGRVQGPTIYPRSYIIETSSGKL